MAGWHDDRRLRVSVGGEDGAPLLERSVSVRALRIGATAGATVVGVFGVAALLQAATLSRVLGHDELVAQNMELRTQLASVQGELEELEPVIQRVRAYDEQLRGLAARGALPGFGPVDADAMAERDAWIEGLELDGEAGLELGSTELFAELRGIDFAEFEANVSLLADATEAMPRLIPAEGPLSSGFGWRRNPFGRSRWKFHTGLDIAADYGAPVLAAGAGVVTLANWDSGYGRAVEIDHGSGIVTRYAHASRLIVREGDEVLAGQTIALVGSSGQSTGPHLHYELLVDGEKVDPRPWLDGSVR